MAKPTPVAPRRARRGPLPGGVPRRRTLYFSTFRFSPRFNLVSKSVHGATLALLTARHSNNIHPAVSPDGKSLAFSSDRDGSWDIYVLQTRPGGTIRRVVTSATATLGPAWSPDGERLACFRGGLVDGTWEVWILDVGSGTQTYLTDGLLPDWSPDGTRITFQRASQRGEGWFSSWTIGADGGRVTHVNPAPGASWGAVNPSWSPDGKWIVFTAVGKRSASPAGHPGPGYEIRPIAPDQDIYRVAVDGTGLTNLTGDRPGVSEWSP